MVEAIQTVRIHRSQASGPELHKGHKGLSRRQISVLTQMRTGHIALSNHLHRVHLSESPKCPHCPNADEDVNHLLFRCRNRHYPTLSLKSNASSVQYLLSDRSSIRHTLNFLNKTLRRYQRGTNRRQRVMLTSSAPTICSC